MPKVAFYTLGCKLNFAETSAIGKQFLDRGYEVVEFGGPADVCVINTCSVTERADRECRQLIRRATRVSPNPFVIVTGCYAQLEPASVASIPGVDLVLGTREKLELFEYLGPLEKALYPHIVVSPINTVNNFGPAYSTAATDRTRAFLKIQDGCDFNCTFCTIPLARGSSRSQSLTLCLVQARGLVEQGYREIVLTGVNVGDYGKSGEDNLLCLLRELVAIDGLERVRISSIEPNLLTREMIGFIAGSQKMCKHVHIPLQSGCDEILRKMRRRYTTRYYRELIDRIRTMMPGCGIGVDVIVGFPGETDSRFEQTYLFLNDLPFSYLHAFTYSERPNTPAAEFQNHVEPKIRFKRNAMVRILGQKKKQAFYESMIGKTSKVLLEGDADERMRYGFTDNYVRVGVPLGSGMENELMTVRIEAVHDDLCVGCSLSSQVAA